MLLALLVLNDAKYRAYALSICKCKQLSDDLVQDMYLKIHRITEEDPEKQLSDSYIYLTIRSLFIDWTRKYQPEQLEKRLLYLAEDEEDNPKLCRRKSVDEALSKLSMYERQILLHSQEHTLRELGEMLDISKDTVANHRNRALEKLKIKICQDEKRILPEQGMQ